MCPHPFEPQGHEFKSTGGRNAVCAVCGGAVTLCPSCREPNRAAARFCVHCGQPLPATPTMPELKSATQLRQSLQQSDQKTSPLTAFLALEDGWMPSSWVASSAGLIVLSTGKGETTRADFVGANDLHTRKVRCLGRDFPSPDRWIAAPFMTEDGLFLVTEDSIDFVIAHGAGSPFERARFRLPPGEGVWCGAGLDTDNGVALVARQDDGTLVLWRGNGQSGAWTKAATLDGPTIATNAGVLVGATTDGSGRWLIADGRVWTAVGSDTPTPTPAPIPTLTMIAGPVVPDLPAITRAWRSQSAAGRLVETITLRAPQGRTQLALTTGGPESRLLLVGLDPGSSVREVRRIGGGWACADASGTTLLVGNDRVIETYVDGRPGPNPVGVGGPTTIPPIVGDRWMILVRPLSGAAADSSANGTEVAVIDRDAAGNWRGNVSNQRKGLPARGLPPLIIGDSLLLATRATGAINAPQISITTIIDPVTPGVA